MPSVIIGNATLYTFSTFKPGHLVNVVRITDPTTDPRDWFEWPKRYKRDSALKGACVIKECIAIARVHLIDDRDSPEAQI